MKKHPMTLNGARKLRDELTELKTVMRPRIIEAIAEARSHGDLKENAEYHAAREQQAFIEGRIQEIEAKLAAAEIIDIGALKNEKRIVFGATVELLNTCTEQEAVYQIVGEDEADIKANLISITSPLARALIGKEIDDLVRLETPGGEVEYEVLEIRYV